MILKCEICGQPCYGEWCERCKERAREADNTEIETYICSGLCGATVEVSISDDSDLLASEQRSGQLDGKGWTVTDQGVWCGECQPVYSHLEEVDQRVDWEREQERL